MKWPTFNSVTLKKVLIQLLKQNIETTLPIHFAYSSFVKCKQEIGSIC